MYVRKSRPTKVADLDEKEGLVQAIVGVTEVKDFQGDIIAAGAFERSLERRPHPLGLAGHDWSARVARTVSAKEIAPGSEDLPATIKEAGGGAVEILGQYHLSDADPEARREFARVAFFGAEQEWSVGLFITDSEPVEDARRVNEIDWIEWSSVVAGAMPLTETIEVKDVRAADRAMLELLAERTEKFGHDVIERWLHLLDVPGIIVDDVEKFIGDRYVRPIVAALLPRVRTKGAIPSHSTPVVDREWDGPEMVARAPSDREALRELHTWVDPDADPNTKEAYKLPHHEVSADGEVGPANIRGVRAALAALAGARGGVDIPEADVDEVRAHLERHVRDWEREASLRNARKRMLVASLSGVVR